MEIQINDSAARRKLDRVQDSIGGGVRSRFQTLGPRLRDELRPRIPKKTGRARGSIFFRMESIGNDEDITLLVGGDLVQAPHLIYIEHGRGRTRGLVHGPIQTFQDKNEDRIRRDMAGAVAASVRAAGGNG